MPEVPDTVDDAIEPLSSPSTDEVFEATRPFSAREIASAAASEALSGGGGGGEIVSCALDRNPNIDIHAVGTHVVAFDTIWDDIYFQNTLDDLPDGLGITGTIDGSHANLTTTEAGVWAFTFAVGASSEADIDIRGYIGGAWGEAAAPFGPLAAFQPPGHVTSVVALPSGAVGAWSVETLVGATNNPFALPPTLVIVRLG